MSRKPSFFNPRRQDNWSGWSRLLALNEQRDPLELSWQVCRWLVITCSQLAKQTIALHDYQTLITIAALNCSNLQRIIVNEKNISLSLYKILYENIIFLNFWHNLTPSFDSCNLIIYDRSRVIFVPTFRDFTFRWIQKIISTMSYR